MKTYRKTSRKKGTPEPPIAPPKEETKKPSKPTYPKLHRDCSIYGDVVQLEDHLLIGVWVRDDGDWRGGELWAKTSWRKTFGKYPWEKQDEVDPTMGISYEF